jgi:hypothetical protein
MDFNSIAFVFNRALALSFSKKKLLMVFCILALSGVLIVFFRGLSVNAGEWVQLSLTFLPIFICTGILLSMGIFLIRIYHDDVKNRGENYKSILSNSWEMIIGASYFAVPIILCYLLLWMLLGIFVLLGEIPAVGDFFSLILSFAQFLINLGTLILCVISLGLLFFVAPLIALKDLSRQAVFQSTVKRLEKDPFSNLVLIFLALVPLAFILFLLSIAASLTGSLCIDCHTPVQTTMKWFFFMIPFAAFLTPAVIFFFNFAAEAHVLMQKRNSEKRE